MNHIHRATIFSADLYHIFLREWQQSYYSNFHQNIPKNLQNLDKHTNLPKCTITDKPSKTEVFPIFVFEGVASTSDILTSPIKFY